VVAILVLSLAACRGSGESSSAPEADGKSATPTAARTKAAKATAPATTSAPNAKDGLTGFGATRAAWAKNHEAATDDQLAPGCCFGPLVQAASGERVYAWNGVLYGSVPVERVVAYSRYFDQGAEEPFALLLLKREDLPRDAEQTFARKLDTCKLVQFSSKSLRAAAGHSLVLVSLASGPDRPYTPRFVEHATVLRGDPSDERDAFC
jgi:hypothetical protein